MTVGVWGDSITYGRRDAQALGWVGRVLMKLYAKDDSFHLYNRGVCGDTSRDLVLRFESEANSIKPNVVIFAIGINDSKFAKENNSAVVSLSEFIQNIQTLINSAKVFTDKVIIVGPTNVVSPTVTTLGSRFSDEQIEPYHKALEELANKNGLQYVALFGVLDTESEIADGIHPNAQGYETIAETILTQVTF